MGQLKIFFNTQAYTDLNRYKHLESRFGHIADFSYKDEGALGHLWLHILMEGMESKEIKFRLQDPEKAKDLETELRNAEASENLVRLNHRRTLPLGSMYGRKVELYFSPNFCSGNRAIAISRPRMDGDPVYS